MGDGSQETGVRRQESGDGRQETGHRIHDTGDRRHMRDRRQETCAKKRITIIYFLVVSVNILIF